MNTEIAKRARRTGGAVLLTLGLGLPAAAQTIDDYPFSEEALNYTACYSAGDGLFPGPAAHFGEDVCVDYTVANAGVVQLATGEAATTDVHWAVFQDGEATVYAVAGNQALLTGYFRLREIAQDKGDDADCTWIATDGTGELRASLDRCWDAAGALDHLTYSWELIGESYYRFETLVSGPGAWCSYDTDGQTTGSACQ